MRKAFIALPALLTSISAAASDGLGPLAATLVSAAFFLLGLLFGALSRSLGVPIRKAHKAAAVAAAVPAVFLFSTAAHLLPHWYQALAVASVSVVPTVFGFVVGFLIIAAVCSLIRLIKSR